MMLSPREIDKMYIFMAAEVARRRQQKGLKLNYTEAIALISDHIVEGAREGRSVPELMSSGKKSTVKEWRPSRRARTGKIRAGRGNV